MTISSSRKAAAAAGLLLLAGEAAMAVLALWFPHVPQTYEQFYIKHTRGCWLPPDAEAAAVQALTASEVEVAALSPDAACYAFMQGWSPIPPWGRTPWIMTAGDQVSWLTLPRAPGAGALEITLAGMSPQFPQSVRLSIDARPATRLTLPRDGVPVHVRLPLEPERGDLRIRFDRAKEIDGYPMAILQFKWIGKE